MASTALTEAIVDTSTDVARATTAILRHGSYVRAGTDPGMGIVSLAGGEVEVFLNGMAPMVGDVLAMIQQGYELLAIGPMTAVVQNEVAISATTPTDPALKLWVKL